MEPILPDCHQIRRTIKHWTRDKTYCPNDKIPTEHELTGQFNVKRMTAR